MKRVIGLALLSLFALTVNAAGDDDVFEWQPEIHHVFRPQEAMPPAWFSKLFTAIVLSPWLVLIIGWLGNGVNPVSVSSQLLSGSSLRTASIVGFLVSLSAIEYVIYLYWTHLNIFQALTYLAPLSAVTFIVGQRALREVQSKRLATK